MTQDLKHMQSKYRCKVQVQGYNVSNRNELIKTFKMY